MSMMWPKDERLTLLGLAGIAGNLVELRALASSGLILRADVDAVWNAILGVLGDNADDPVLARMIKDHLEPLIADARAAATT